MKSKETHYQGKIRKGKLQTFDWDSFGKRISDRVTTVGFAQGNSAEF